MVKFELKNASVTVPVVGDGGYANKSSLELDVLSVGKIKIADPWDLSFLKGKEIQNDGLILRIPSGTLRFLGSISVSLETEEDGFKNLVFRAQEARWSGKQDGYFGGMSAYGNFRAQIEWVVEGTYMLPEDYTGRSFKNLATLPLEEWPCFHQVDWETYKRRQWAVEAVDRQQALSLAASAAKMLAIPASDRTSQIDESLSWWWDYIRQELKSLEGFDTYETVSEAMEADSLN
jgi:hypothetical protein